MSDRYIDPSPYDPDSEQSAPARPDLDAPNWLLIWRKFRQHKLGLVSGLFLLVSYLMMPFAGFIAPYSPNEIHRGSSVRRTANGTSVSQR